MELTQPGPNADGWRRPEFFMRPVTPKRKMFKAPPATSTG